MRIWLRLASESERSVGGDNEHRLPDDGLEIHNGGDEEDLGSADKTLLAEEHKEAGLVERIHTQITGLLGTSLGALGLVEEGEADVGVLGGVDVPIAGRVGAGEVEKSCAGALGVAVADAEGEGAPVTVGVVVKKHVAVQGADGDHKSGAEPCARRRDGNKGKELKNTIGLTGIGGGWLDARVRRVGGVISGTIRDKRTRVVGHKGTVGILLNNINVVVVDKVLHDDTSRIHNKSAVNGVGQIDGNIQRSGEHRTEKIQERLRGLGRVLVGSVHNLVVGIHGGSTRRGRNSSKPDIIDRRICLIHKRHSSQDLEGFVAGVYDAGGRHFTLLKYIFFIS